MSANRQTREQIVAQLTQRTTDIMKRLTPLEVVQTLALHVSINPQFLNSAAIFITQNMSRIRDTTLEEQIAQMFADAFLLPMRLEVTTSKASNGMIDGFVYPFGAERSLFAVPIKLFRYSTSAYACLARLLNEPGQMPEGSSFASVRISSENSTVMYSQFQYNATLNAVYSRFSLVCAFCASLCATARVAQANHTDSNDLKLMRTMVHGALAMLQERLLKVESAHTNRNISAATLDTLGKLIAACQSLNTFNSDTIMKVAAEHDIEICRKHTLRVSL